jgi:hypothetical protein
MGAAGQPMQDSHAEGGPRLHVKMRGRLAVSMGRVVVGGAVVHVNVRVAVPVMLVLVYVDPLPGRLPDAPDADRDEHQPHQPLAPARHLLDRENLSQEKRRQPHDDHSTRMTEPPQEACGPRTLLSVGRKRRDGRQVVRPGKDVDRARGQAGDEGSDHGVPELSAEGGGP